MLFSRTKKKKKQLKTVAKKIANFLHISRWKYFSVEVDYYDIGKDKKKTDERMFRRIGGRDRRFCHCFMEYNGLAVSGAIKAVKSKTNLLSSKVFTCGKQGANIKK